MTLDVLSGELRSDLFALFSGAPNLRTLLTTPGLVARPPAAALVSLAAAPHRPLSAADAHAWLRVYLDELSAELDMLPQSLEWERRLVEARSRLADRSWTARFYGRDPVFERLVCRNEETVWTAAPLTRALADRFPDESPLPLLRGELHRRAQRRFAALWEAADDVTPLVEQLIAESWAGGLVDPSDLYHKVALEYFEDTLADPAEDDDNPLLEVMADFQIRAYQTAKGMLRRYGGVFLSDVVGLGKTYIGLALVRHLQVRYGQHAVVVGPPAVCHAWRDLAAEHRTELQTVSHGKLSDLERFADREVLVVDESHNFRNADTARYEALQRWLRDGDGLSHRRVILVSATPQNNRARDVLRQLQLLPDGFSRLPFAGESLESFFRDVEAGRASLREVLQHVVVRRTRRFIQAQYPEARIRQRGPDGRMEWAELRFPVRICGPEQCLRYAIDDTYAGGLYARIMDTLAMMAYPLYGLAAYVRHEHEDDPRLAGVGRSGVSLRGLVKVLLLKRLESSVHAFRQTLRRLRERLRAALERLERGEVVVRQGRVARSTADDEGDDAFGLTGERVVEVACFHTDRLEKDLLRDLDRVSRLLEAVEGLDPTRDAKLARLRQALASRPPSRHRTIVFTQFADTAEYIARALGADHGRLEQVAGSSGGTLNVLRRFAPRAQRAQIPAEAQIDLLVTTDALSEGVNLQDADTLINYDIHWNPIRLIQRAGRIDRLGSANDQILIASFLPERALESELRLEEVVRRRIEEFTRVFGEDGDVLPSEEVPEAQSVVEAYDGQALDANDAAEDLDGLAYHAERVLRLRTTEPERYARIQALRDGRRGVSAAAVASVAALRAGWLWGFYRRDGALARPVDHVDGLDLLWRHAQAVLAADGCSAASVYDFLDAASTAFANDAELVNVRRAAPRLSAVEAWVLDTLDSYRPSCPQHRRPLLDRAVEWLRAAQYSARLRSAAQRWRKEGLPPTVVLEEMALLMRRLPLRDDNLGPPRLVATVIGGR